MTAPGDPTPATGCMESFLARSATLAIGQGLKESIKTIAELLLHSRKESTILGLGILPPIASIVLMVGAGLGSLTYKWI
jgi:hypothetical protein